MYVTQTRHRHTDIYHTQIYAHTEACTSGKDVNTKNLTMFDS